MSDKQCNLCLWNGIQADAARKGKVAVLCTERKGWLVSYVTPPGIDLESMTNRQRRKYRRIAFMEVPSQCAC